MLLHLISQPIISCARYEASRTNQKIKLKVFAGPVRATVTLSPQSWVKKGTTVTITRKIKTVGNAGPPSGPRWHGHPKIGSKREDHDKFISEGYGPPSRPRWHGHKNSRAIAPVFLIQNFTKFPYILLEWPFSQNKEKLELNNESSCLQFIVGIF